MEPTKIPTTPIPTANPEIARMNEQLLTEYLANLKKGDIVALLEADAVRGHWPIGRIISTHPGTDGRVRSATVKIAKGQVNRPIAKMAMLVENDIQFGLAVCEWIITAEVGYSRTIFNYHVVTRCLDLYTVVIVQPRLSELRVLHITINFCIDGIDGIDAMYSSTAQHENRQ